MPIEPIIAVHHSGHTHSPSIVKGLAMQDYSKDTVMRMHNAC